MAVAVALGFPSISEYRQRLFARKLVGNLSTLLGPKQPFIELCEGLGMTKICDNAYSTLLQVPRLWLIETFGQ